MAPSLRGLYHHAGPTQAMHSHSHYLSERRSLDLHTSGQSSRQADPFTAATTLLEEGCSPTHQGVLRPAEGASRSPAATSMLGIVGPTNGFMPRHTAAGGYFNGGHAGHVGTGGGGGSVFGHFLSPAQIAPEKSGREGSTGVLGADEAVSPPSHQWRLKPLHQQQQQQQKQQQQFGGAGCSFMAQVVRQAQGVQFVLDGPVPQKEGQGVDDGDETACVAAATIAESSEGACRLLGLQPAEASKLTLFDVSPDLSISKWRDALGQLRKQEAKSVSIPLTFACRVTKPLEVTTNASKPAPKQESRKKKEGKGGEGGQVSKQGSGFFVLERRLSENVGAAIASSNEEVFTGVSGQNARSGRDTNVSASALATEGCATAHEESCERGVGEGSNAVVTHISSPGMPNASTNRRTSLEGKDSILREVLRAQLLNSQRISLSAKSSPVLLAPAAGSNSESESLSGGRGLVGFNSSGNSSASASPLIGVSRSNSPPGSGEGSSPASGGEDHLSRSSSWRVSISKGARSLFSSPKRSRRGGAGERVRSSSTLQCFAMPRTASGMRNTLNSIGGFEEDDVEVMMSNGGRLSSEDESNGDGIGGLRSSMDTLRAGRKDSPQQGRSPQSVEEIVVVQAVLELQCYYFGGRSELVASAHVIPSVGSSSFHPSSSSSGGKGGGLFHNLLRRGRSGGPDLEGFVKSAEASKVVSRVPSVLELDDSARPCATTGAANNASDRTPTSSPGACPEMGSGGPVPSSRAEEDTGAERSLTSRDAQDLVSSFACGAVLLLAHGGAPAAGDSRAGAREAHVNEVVGRMLQKAGLSIEGIACGEDWVQLVCGDEDSKERLEYQLWQRQGAPLGKPHTTKIRASNQHSRSSSTGGAVGGGSGGVVGTSVGRRGGAEGETGIVVEATAHALSFGELWLLSEGPVAASSSSKSLSGVLRGEVMGAPETPEQTERKTNSKFKSLFELSSDPKLLLDTAGRICDCNAATVSILKFPSKEALLGKTPWMLSPAMQTNGTPAALLSRLLQEMLRPPAPTAAGGPTSSAALGSSSGPGAGSTTSSPFAGGSGVITAVGGSVFGGGSGVIGGGSVASVFSGIGSPFGRMIGMQQMRRFEWTFRDMEGKTVPVEVQVKRVDSHVEGAAFLMVWHDISDLKQHEAELERAKAEAEKASKAKTQFLANMSHEIRTPMNGIIGVADMLLDTPVTDDQKMLLEAIRSSSEGLLHVLSDILDLSKIENEKLELDFTDWDVRAHLAGCTALYLTAARDKGVQLISHIDADVPIRVLGDTVRVRQVLLNLISNSLKFTHHGSITIRVSLLDPNEGAGGARGKGSGGKGMNKRRESFSNLEALQDPSMDKVVLQYDVEDTGIGMSLQTQQKLFHAFTQADSSTCRKFGGTGLGLAICKSLVHLMGGDISVTSEEGKGSCFTFTVCVGVTEESPLGDVDEEDSDCAVEEEDGEESEGNTAPAPAIISQKPPQPHSQHSQQHQQQENHQQQQMQQPKPRDVFAYSETEDWLAPAAAPSGTSRLARTSSGLKPSPQAPPRDTRAPSPAKRAEGVGRAEKHQRQVSPLRAAVAGRAAAAMSAGAPRSGASKHLQSVLDQTSNNGSGELASNYSDDSSTTDENVNSGPLPLQGEGNVGGNGGSYAKTGVRLSGGARLSVSSQESNDSGLSPRKSGPRGGGGGGGSGPAKQSRRRRKSFEEEVVHSVPEFVKSWRVLVAEDNKVNQMVVSRMLRNMGLTFDVVENGKLAREACQKTEYNLILMDCHMPEMDGLEATRLIRQDEAEAAQQLNGEPERIPLPKPIAALTASAFEFEKQSCFNAGMTHFITKPVRPKDLEDLVLGIVNGMGIASDAPPA